MASLPSISSFHELAEEYNGLTENLRDQFNDFLNFRIPAHQVNEEITNFQNRIVTLLNDMRLRLHNGPILPPLSQMLNAPILPEPVPTSRPTSSPMNRESSPVRRSRTRSPTRTPEINTIVPLPQFLPSTMLPSMTNRRSEEGSLSPTRFSQSPQSPQTPQTENQRSLSPVRGAYMNQPLAEPVPLSSLSSLSPLPYSFTHSTHGIGLTPEQEAALPRIRPESSQDEESEPNEPTEQCKHMFMRGLMTGQQCPKPATSNSVYCTIHKRLHQK